MSRALALDPGTAFFQVAEKNSEGEIEFKTIRNSFVEISDPPLTGILDFFALIP